jgi:hypothetical protein
LTSERQISANRANARASTGPKTVRGRAVSARNALRHGLNIPIYSDPALSEQVEALACELAGSGPSAEIQELARRVAEAQIDLRRVQYASHNLLSRALRNPCDDSQEDELRRAIMLSDNVPQLLAMDHYARRAFSRRKFAVRALDAARRR